MANRATTWSNGNQLTSAALNAEFDNVYTGTLERTAGRAGQNDNIPVSFGSSQDAYLEWDTAQTQDALMLGLSGSNTFIVCEKADMATDFGLAARTNPTIIVHSADATTVADYLELSHNQTDAVVNAGAGGIDFQLAGTRKAYLSASGLSLSQTASGNFLSLTSTDAGATGGIIEMYHNSASPADNDVIATLAFYGGDDNASHNKTNYASIQVLAQDVTDTSESGSIGFHTMVDGTLRKLFQVGVDPEDAAETYVMRWYDTAGVLCGVSLASATQHSLSVSDADLGNDAAGPMIGIGRNSNATNPNPGSLILTDSAGNVYYIWVDTTGDLRIGTTPPAGATSDTSGVVVGDQFA